MIDSLDETNFVLYAAKHYDNPECFDTEEFFSDLKRFKYLKRLFNKYQESGELKERLILNHIILLNNVFGPEATARILFYKIDQRDYDVLKTFLMYLNILPDMIYGINGKNIRTGDIPLDNNIAEILLKI